jgi:uncharacterized protein YndB with AHSA1/START domain
MKQYWFGVHCDSEFTAGSSWRVLSPEGQTTDSGWIVEAEPSRRLVIRWQNKPELKEEGESQCTMELELS